MASQIVTTRLLNKIRALNIRIMPTTGTVYRRSLSNDGNGGKAETYTSNASYECRVKMENSKTDKQEGGRIKNEDHWIASFPYDADIVETDRIEFSTMADETFEIVGPIGEPSFNVGRRLRLRRVR